MSPKKPRTPKGITSSAQTRSLPPENLLDSLLQKSLATPVDDALAPSAIREKHKSLNQEQLRARVALRKNQAPFRQLLKAMRKRAWRFVVEGKRLDETLARRLRDAIKASDEKIANEFAEIVAQDIVAGKSWTSTKLSRRTHDYVCLNSNCKNGKNGQPKKFKAVPPTHGIRTACCLNCRVALSRYNATLKNKKK